MHRASEFVIVCEEESTAQWPVAFGVGTAAHAIRCWVGVGEGMTVAVDIAAVRLLAGGWTNRAVVRRWDGSDVLCKTPDELSDALAKLKEP